MLAPPPMVVYQLKVALRGISPLVCCRLLIRAETSFADLHHIRQMALGWTNSHIHRFLIHGQEYSITYEGGMGVADEPRHIRLADFCFRLRERFLDQYGFDDKWQHGTCQNSPQIIGLTQDIGVGALQAVPRIVPR